MPATRLLKNLLLVSVCSTAAYPAMAQEKDVADAAAIESILIIGSKEKAQKLPGSGAYLGALELEQFEYGDIHRILRQIPGVNIQEEDGFGLRPNIGLRGTSVERSEKITLMEDGVLIAPAPYAAPAAYYFPTAGRMSALEVSKGPSAIAHGPNTVGGAINLVSTPIPDAFSGQVEARFGSFDFYQVHAYAGGKLDGFGALVETYQAGTDGFKQLDGGGDTGFNIEDYVLKLSYETGEDAAVPQSISVKLGFTDQESDETYLGLSDADFAENPYRRYAASQNDRFESRHKQAQITHHADFSPNFEVTTVGYYNDYFRDWFKLDDLNLDGTGRIRPRTVFETMDETALAVLRGEVDSIDDALQLRHNARDYYSWGIQSIGHYRVKTGDFDHQIEFSIRYHKDEEDRVENRENFAIRSGALVPTSVDAPGSLNNREQKGKAWSFYVADRVEWDRLTLTPGVRVEVIELTRFDYDREDPERLQGPSRVRENDLTIVLPGIGASYEVSDDLLLIAGVHRGFSPPSPGSNEADAEKSVNYEAGFRYNSDLVSFEAIGFFSDYSNVLGSCTNAVGCVVGDIGDQFNGGDVHTFGLELSGGVDIPLTPEITMPLRFNYTYTDADFRNTFDSDFFGNVERGFALPYIPKHQGLVSAGLEAQDWDVVLSANYVGDVRTEAGVGAIPTNELIANRTVFDVATHYQALDHVRLFFSVENLFDNEYAVARRPYGLRPGKPRSYAGGISVSF